MLGIPAHGWGLGRNEGPTGEVIDALRAKVVQLHERYEAPVGIVGWSLGGVHGLVVADLVSDRVRAVVTLGCPIRSIGAPDPPTTVPVTSIWSRNDRVVAWQASRLDDATRRENIEVRATHVTLGFDPLVFAAVADRMAQNPADWRPFRPPPLLAGLYP